MADKHRSFLDPKVLGRLMALPLHARQAMLGSVSGKHRSSVKGSSLEFAQYRKYVPGDDTRRLDWRTWGRSDRFYVKEFEADTNLRLCLLIDASGSMGFGAKGATRLDYARKLAATLGYLAARQGDARAFDALVYRYQAHIRQFVRSRLDAAIDTEDVAQEVFVAAWRDLPRFQGRSRFKTPPTPRWPRRCWAPAGPGRAWW